MSEKRSWLKCSYENCQAGGIILPGAPWVDNIFAGIENTQFMHPGCMAALKYQVLNG